MEEKSPKFYVYIIAILILAIGAVLAWQYILAAKSDIAKSDPARLSGLFQARDQGPEEKNQRVQEWDNQIAQLRKELEESANRVAELQTRLEETRKALSATEQKLKIALRQADHPPSVPSQSQEKSLSRPVGPAAPLASRRPAEPGSYEVIRSTSVFAEPSDSSRQLSTIGRGTRVTVVGSVGEWLEVRSKHDNPPGFVRRDDAMFVEKKD